MPWPRPKTKNVCCQPTEPIMLAIGMTVSAEPMPKPAAVIPAARPRRSGNHLMALPTQVP